jgi:hypothetical protein
VSNQYSLLYIYIVSIDMTGRYITLFSQYPKPCLHWQYVSNQQGIGKGSIGIRKRKQELREVEIGARHP